MSLAALLVDAFVAGESAGTWSAPETPATTSALSDEVSATLLSVSCSTGGNCGAGGSYEQSAGPSQPIVVSEVGGTWGSAGQVPGVSSLNVGHSGGTSAISQVDSISCTDTGDCSIGGFYTDANGLGQDFVDSQVSGTWDTAAPLPHTTTSVGNGSEVLSVSCWSAGNCNAGGDFARHDMVAPERGGVWGVPVSPAAGVANANYPSQVLTVSCAPDGGCGAGGDYAVLTSGHIYDIPFDSSYSAAPLATLPGRPTNVSLVPGDLSLTVKWSVGSTGGIPVTYTASASSGGGSCQSSGTTCVIAFASAAKAYTVTVTPSNEVGSGPSSLPTAPLYPFRPKHFLAEASSSIQSKNVSFTAFAGDAKPHAVIKFTFAGTSKSCTATSLGQCSIVLLGKATGVFKVKVSSGSSRATIPIYFPLVKAPSTVAHGSSATITVTSCPSNAKVQLSLSDKRQFTGRASTSGAATFKVPMPTALQESVTTQVNGTTLARPIVIKVT